MFDCLILRELTAVKTNSDAKIVVQSDERNVGLHFRVFLEIKSNGLYEGTSLLRVRRVQVSVLSDDVFYFITLEGSERNLGSSGLVNEYQNRTEYTKWRKRPGIASGAGSYSRQLAPGIATGTE